MRTYLMIALASCGSSTEPSDSADSGTTPDDSVLVADGIEVRPPERPNPDIAAYTYVIRATTDVPARLTVRWTNGDHDVEVQFPDLATEHEHLLLGWRPDSTYTVTAFGTSEDGIDTESVDTSLVTEPLPDHYPTAEVFSASSEAIAPGHTIVAIRTPPGEGRDPRGVGVVYDEEGHVVWTLDLKGIAEDIRNYDNAIVHAMVGVGDAAIVRHYDWAGFRLQQWAINNTDEAITNVSAGFGELFHHDVSPVPGADEFVGITRRPLTVPEYPTDSTYTLPDALQPNVTIADDVFVHFDHSGTVLSETRLATLIDTTRIGYDSLEEVTQGWADWSHANAIEWIDGDLIVSLRHQDAVIRVDPTGPNLVWILGNPFGWTEEYQEFLLEPMGNLHWNYHQHAPMIKEGSTPANTQILMFDNGNWRASPFDGQVRQEPEESSSRLAEFTINENDMTVAQSWSWSTGESTLVPGLADLFSAAVGDADYLSNGNILGTWGFLSQAADGSSNAANGLGFKSVRLIEIDPTTSEDVWHLHLSTTEQENPEGWTIYRSDRIESLYGRIVD